MFRGESECHLVVSSSLQPHGLYSPLNFPGQNTGVGSLSLLQEIFPTQGLNPGLQHCRSILCDPMDCSLPGSSVHGILQARILEWIAIPFFKGIFPTQGSNLDLLHCRQILYCLNHQGSPIKPCPCVKKNFFW